MFSRVAPPFLIAAHNTTLFLTSFLYLPHDMWGMVCVGGGLIMGPVAALLLLLLITMCGYYPSRLQQAGKYKLYDLTPCKPDNNRVVHFEYWYEILKLKEDFIEIVKGIFVYL